MSRCVGVVLVSIWLTIASLSSTTHSQPQQSPEFAVVIIRPEKWLPLPRADEAYYMPTVTDKLRELYGRRQPTLDEEIFVSSSTGRLAEIAAQKLMRMGYTRLQDQPQITNTGKVIIGLCPPDDQLDSAYTPSGNNVRRSPYIESFGPTTLDPGIRPTRLYVPLRVSFSEQPTEDTFRRVFDRTTSKQFDVTCPPEHRADISDQYLNSMEFNRRDHAQSQFSNTEKLPDDERAPAERLDDVVQFQMPYPRIDNTLGSTTLQAPIDTLEEVSNLQHDSEGTLDDVIPPKELLDTNTHPTSNNEPRSRFDETVSSTTPSSPQKAPVATFEEVLALPRYPRKLLVGVRLPKEVLDTGDIPTSINVPLPRVAEMFSDKTTAEEFRQLYGRDKPALDDEIITACRTGRRAEIAAQQLMRLGYTRVKNYRGSWADWAARNGLPPQ